MNWVSEVTKPLTSEPYTPMMALGTRKPGDHSGQLVDKVPESVFGKHRMIPPLKPYALDDEREGVSAVASQSLVGATVIRIAHRRLASDE